MTTVSAEDLATLAAAIVQAEARLRSIDAELTMLTPLLADPDAQASHRDLLAERERTEGWLVGLRERHAAAEADAARQAAEDRRRWVAAQEALRQEAASGFEAACRRLAALLDPAAVREAVAAVTAAGERQRDVGAQTGESGAHHILLAEAAIAVWAKWLLYEGHVPGYGMPVVGARPAWLWPQSRRG